MKFLRVVCTLIILQINLIVGLIETDIFKLKVKKSCTKNSSYQESRMVPYLERFKEKKWGIFYRANTRWNYRAENYTSWHDESVCCDGYTETDDNLCEPICKSCTHGICIKPELCLCKIGYGHNLENGRTTCVPLCNSNCEQGSCTAPNVCGCEHGYELTALNTCIPVCDSASCGPGSYCSKPNECSCFDGHVDRTISNISLLGYTKMCDPVCDRCENGKCLAPNFCVCNAGYEKFSTFNPLSTCEPKCGSYCYFGKCVAPNVCSCKEGYLSKGPETPCEPVCSQPCENGTCVAPELCLCSRGYELLPGSNYVCERVCEKACVNGKCTASGRCICDEGYVLGDGMYTCKPYCKFSCGRYGTCTAPNSCSCPEGHRKAKESIIHGECEPICSKICVNGFCIAPDDCGCFFNHIMVGSNATHVLCEPRCRHCVHGLCDTPTTCKCNDGYELSHSRRSVPFECKPSCDNCANGHCVEPNICSCHFGYILVKDNGTNVCKPYCRPNCKNGICVEFDTCSCNDGYGPAPTSDNVCDPICHEACGTNEVCEAPDQCACKKGYQRYNNESISSRCEPICINCGNGTCVAPGHCKCFDGYRKAAKGGCEPICTLCNNGTCIAPEICECDDGFVLEWSGVEDVPSSRHIPEDRSNGSRCVPRCEGCENGDCVAPDECRCRAGFVRAENTCVAACEAGCIHGECIEERRICECNYGWTGLRCEQPTFCVSIFDNEENRTETLNIVEERNATFEYVLTNNPACPKCISKVNNETLCFKMYTNDTRDEAQIGCLMEDGECLSLKSQYNDQKEVIKISGFAIGTGILFLICAATVTHLILRKRRRGIDLDSEHNESLQGLMAINS